MRAQLQALRGKMEERGLDAYLIPTADYHGSEYVEAYFKCREYVSGFTGSAGTLVVLRKEAGLWTDGRYYLQAEAQLAGSGITLFKSGMPGVPEPMAWLREKLPDGAVLAFDGRVVDAESGQAFSRMMKEKKGSLVWDVDLVGEIWTDRPARSCRPAYLLDLAYTGKSSVEKQKDVREKMREAGAAYFLLTSPDDIAWLFNLRGSDVEDNPVVMAYVLMTAQETFLYVHPESFGPHVTGGLERVGVTLRPYDRIYEDLKQVNPEDPVMLEKRQVNYRLLKSIPQGTRLYHTVNPTAQFKAVKTEAEIRWAGEVHVRDGLAVTRFMKWLKENVGRIPMTERSAAEELEKFRRMEKSYRGPSFATIAGYREHGAVIHYQATEETDCELHPEGMLLVDSGGQYTGGTTDVTRTFILGELTEAERRHYTMAVKAMLRLADVQFPEGVSGEHLDVLARQVFWKEGLDYRHGTGHGVGSFLNVHERPNGFHWHRRPGSAEWVFRPGMITSDEPGYYADGKYGIRIEDLLLCVQKEETEYGRFLGFEHLTSVPIDRDGLDPELMSDEDIRLLNAYHAGVWTKLEPYLDEEEKAWLLSAVQPLHKKRESGQSKGMSGRFYRPMSTEPEYFT